MSNNDEQSWYSTKPLHYAFDGILHDLLEPCTAFYAVADLLQYHTRSDAGCHLHITQLKQTLQSIVETEVKGVLLSLRDHMINMASTTARDDANEMDITEEPLDSIVLGTARRIYKHAIEVQSICEDFAVTCVQHVPVDDREIILRVLEHNVQKLLMRVDVLERIIVPRIRNERIAGV